MKPIIIAILLASAVNLTPSIVIGNHLRIIEKNLYKELNNCSRQEAYFSFDTFPHTLELQMDGDIQMSGYDDHRTLSSGLSNIAGWDDEGTLQKYSIEEIMDEDWYKLNTTLSPTNIDSAERSGYTLFKGLSGGINTKIEILKEGYLQFDKSGLHNAQAWILRVRPLQDIEGAPDFGLVHTVFDNAHGRKNDTYALGINAGNNPNHLSSYWSFEGNYEPSAIDSFFETHYVVKANNGINYRPVSMFFSKSDVFGWQLAYNFRELVLRDPRTLSNDSIYFRVRESSLNETNFQLLASGFSTNGSGKGVEFYMNATPGLEAFHFGPYGTMPGTTRLYSTFNDFNVKKLRIENLWGTQDGSDGLAASIIGREGFYGGVVEVNIGNGLDLINGTLSVDQTELTDVNGIYSGDGSTPSNLAVTITDQINFDSGTFFIDGTNNRIGIGTQTPGSTLHVIGTARITGSDGMATTIMGRDIESDLTDVGTGWGIGLAGGNLAVDSSQVATKYDVTSGFYLPVTSNATNTDSSPIPTEAQYMKVLNVVTVSGRINIDPSLDSTLVSFDLSLPIGSILTLPEYISGTGHSGTTWFSTIEIKGNTGTNCALFRFIPMHDIDLEAHNFSYTFTYRLNE